MYVTIDERMRARLRAIFPNIYGINLRLARKFWRLLGGSSWKGRANGEEFFSHPAFPGACRCNCREKRCPYELCKRLRLLILRSLDMAR